MNKPVGLSQNFTGDKIASDSANPRSGVVRQSERR